MPLFHPNQSEHHPLQRPHEDVTTVPVTTQPPGTLTPVGMRTKRVIHTEAAGIPMLEAAGTPTGAGMRTVPHRQLHRKFSL